MNIKDTQRISKISKEILDKYNKTQLDCKDKEIIKEIYQRTGWKEKQTDYIIVYSVLNALTKESKREDAIFTMSWVKLPGITRLTRRFTLKCKPSTI